MGSVNDKEIKKSAEDTSGSIARPSAITLKAGEEFDRCVVACKTQAVVPAGYLAARVIDYNNFNAMWDHNLVNFYYQNETDPTTTIVSFRVTPDGDVTSTDTEASWIRSTITEVK